MLRLLLTATSFAALGGVASAAVIDFDDPAIQGAAISSITSSDGLIGATISATGGIGEAVVFDTSATGTADPDLEGPFRLEGGVPGTGTTTPGGVLIIQENDLASGGPDDTASGGSISFAFDQAIDFTGFSIFDGATITVSSSSVAGSSVFSVGEPVNEGPGNRVFNTFSTAGLFDGVSDLTFAFEGSGAIDSLLVAPVAGVSPIPVPAALPLLLAGLGGLGLVSRRRRKGA